MNTDKVRAAVITTLLNAIPVLQLAGVLHLTSDGNAAISLFINSIVTLVFLLLPNPKAPAS